MNPKVSILVPIYNVSAYIEKCARSLFNQTFEDIEYIFVNDATPDDSIEKLNKVITEFPERKDRTKIIHHEINKGLAYTRNTAIDASNGMYISVVDSDDFIEPEMIETLYLEAINENADIVVSNLYIDYFDRNEIFEEYLSKNRNEQFRDYLKFNKSSPSLCNKLIRASLYKNRANRVPNGLNYLEDRYVMCRFYFFAKKIIKIDQAFYHYIQYNNTSITKQKNRMHFKNVILFWDMIESFLKEQRIYEKYKDLIELPKVQIKASLMIETRSIANRKEFANLFSDIEMRHLKELRTGEKVMLLLVRYRLFFAAQILHKILVMKNKTKLNA